MRILGLLITLWAVAYALQRWNVRRGARKIENNIKNTYGGAHEYAPANPSDFARLDLSFYDRVQNELQLRGYRFMGDVENLTISRTYPSLRTFIRTLISGSGTTLASIYDLKPGGWLRLLSLLGAIPSEVRAIDLETEFKDGTWIVTTTAKNAHHLSSPAEIEMNYRPGDQLEDLLSEHERRLDKASNSGLESRPFQGAADIENARARLQQIKSKHRLSIGLITRGELENIGGPRLGKEARAVDAEIRRRADESQRS